MVGRFGRCVWVGLLLACMQAEVLFPGVWGWLLALWVCLGPELACWLWLGWVADPFALSPRFGPLPVFLLNVVGLGGVLGRALAMWVGPGLDLLDWVVGPFARQCRFGRRYARRGV